MMYCILYIGDYLSSIDIRKNTIDSWNFSFDIAFDHKLHYLRYDGILDA